MRSDAHEILEFFKAQGVTIKVISGDNPATVAAVARRAGVPHADVGLDARTLPDSDDEPAEFSDMVTSTSVFGRVTPHQKRAMVRALQERGHVVAMTGDGVNDVLALKDADMGIAMGSGSSSTRAVAQLVLLDNKFATLPLVLAEGRRVINNIERVANLFITKATYAVLLTLLVGLSGSPFPFLPRQLTLIGTFSIGLPGFFLALSANEALVRPGFLRRVLRYSIPAGIVAGGAAYAVFEITRAMDDVTLDRSTNGGDDHTAQRRTRRADRREPPPATLEGSAVGLDGSALRERVGDRLPAQLLPARSATERRLERHRSSVRSSRASGSGWPLRPSRVSSPTSRCSLVPGTNEHVAPSTGIEPVACRLGGDRSIQLSYEGRRHSLGMEPLLLPLTITPYECQGGCQGGCHGGRHGRGARGFGARQPKRSEATLTTNTQAATTIATPPE